MYLFGSRARGTHSKDSDYDIAVISTDFSKMNFLEQLVRPLIRDAIRNNPIDVACTPEEYERGKQSFLPKRIEQEDISV